MSTHFNPNGNNVDKGRFDAELFLQSLADHGDAMTHTEAGDAFAATVLEAIGAIIKTHRAEGGEAAGAAMKCHGAFLSRIGESLYWQAEKEREERNAFSYDGSELRRLIAHAHEVADKALGDFENHVMLVDTVAAVVKDLRAMAHLIGMDAAPAADAAAGRQVAKVISIALAEVAKKKGGAA